jgi:glycosyltransferase involved in cell wall biosynthesis
MRVAFDAAPCRARPTGVGVYIRDLGSALVAAHPESIALIGVRPDGPLAGTTAVPTTLSRGHHQTWLQRRAAHDTVEVGATLAHFTNGYASLRSPVPYVLTVQDLSTVFHPRWHPSARLVLVPLLLASMARAAAVIVPSLATRREIERLVPRRISRRVVVIPHAPSSRVRVPSPAQVAAIRARLGLGDRPYIATVGTNEPRKNHARLLAAFDRVAVREPDLALVLVGPTGWGRQALGRSADIGGRPRVIVTGWLDDRELAATVAGAEAFAYVSLYEGYGLPVIEAMGLGVPVVTSDRSSMPEVAGGAAVLVDPTDAGAIATGIELARRDRAALVVAGAARHASRRWADVAVATMDVYRWAGRRRR